MYQRSSHEPRYKQSTRAREPRHAEPNEYSEVSSSSEEEESSDRCTGETEEESVGSPSFRESKETRDLGNRGGPIKHTSCDKFYTTPYLAVTRISKKDQFTQKNLLSPFPSYWAPPVEKEVSKGTNYRVSNIMPISEEQKSFQSGEKSPTHTPKVRESHEENDELKKRSPNEMERKLWEKHKSGKDGRPSKIVQPEQTARREHHEPSGKLLKPLVENFSKTLGAKMSSRRPKTSSRDIESNNKMSKNCPECVAMIESRSQFKRKSTVGAATSEKDPRPQDIIPSKDIGDGKLVKSKGKEVKEKLVYVVEEEGKDATKIETDIFSLNEILAIKKDLIELSEFAKKLKKLKEMKKDSESDQNKKNSCHCHPAEELLRDVNKRIEALEAKQEELERKSQCGNFKRDPKIRSKKMIKLKTFSVSPPKTPILANLSAATTVPSDPKTEVLETRAEGFACNSDIVNELMDIKTQLEKLEKKRMLKEVSKEAVPQKETKLSKAKDHAIAVFSSKTYILTTENFDKAKNGKPIGEKSRKELTKENVVNWLKSFSLERTDNDVSVFLSADAKREEFKGQNYIPVSKQEDFENEEPQKNRALENLERGADRSLTCFVKNRFIEESSQFGEKKKCIVTSSGRFVAVLSKSSVNLEKSFPKECNPSANPQRLSPKIVHRSASNGSVPSTILIKRKLKKLKSQLTKKKHRNEMRVIRSKSATTTTSKIEKAPENRKAKNSDKTESSASPSNKKPKEGKHEFLKRLEAQFAALARNLGMVDPSTTSYSYSELLASVDLETTSSKKWPENPNENQIIMFSATKKKNDKGSSAKKKKSQGDKPKPKKKKSCEEECKELKRKRRLEEKCKKLQEMINKEEVKREEPKKEKKKIKKEAKKAKPKPVRHYHHHGCRSCLLFHPWHPPCNKKSENQKESPIDVESSEEKNPTSSLTECSSSQNTQESCTYSEESEASTTHQESPHYAPSLCPIIKDPPPRCGSRKQKRSGLMHTSLNLDQGLLRKFFKNIGRCYPRASDKELSFNSNKYCPEKVKKCPEQESAPYGSDERCFHTANSENAGKAARSSQLRSQSPPPGPSAHDLANRSPMYPPRLPQELRYQRSSYFLCHPQEPHPIRAPHSRRHPLETPRQHLPPHFQHHPPEPYYLRPSHTQRHYYKEPEPQYVDRCDCEFVGALMESGNLSSVSSFKPFELLEDEKSKATLRSRKNRKCKKSDSEVPKFNHQVYLVNRMIEDVGKDRQFFDKTGRNSLLCACSKCGNVHRRTEIKFTSQSLLDQKAINRKLKRVDRYDPLLEQKLQERLEDDFRREYGNYGDYNYDFNKSEQYEVRTLGFRPDQYAFNNLDPASDPYVTHDLDPKSDQSDIQKPGRKHGAHKSGHKADHHEAHKSGHKADHHEAHKSGHKADHQGAHKSGHKADHHDAHKSGHKADHHDAHKSGHKADHHDAHKSGHKADHQGAHKSGPKSDHQGAHKSGHKADHHDAHKSGHKADHHDAHKSGHKADHQGAHKSGHKADHQGAHKSGHKAEHHEAHKSAHKSDHDDALSLDQDSDPCCEQKITKKPDPCCEQKITKKPDPCCEQKICKKPDPCSEHKTCKKPDPCTQHKTCKKPEPCTQHKTCKKPDPCSQHKTCKKPDHKTCKKPDPCTQHKTCKKPDHKTCKKPDPCTQHKTCKKPDHKTCKKPDPCSQHKTCKKPDHKTCEKSDPCSDHKICKKSNHFINFKFFKRSDPCCDRVCPKKSDPCCGHICPKKSDPCCGHICPKKSDPCTDHTCPKKSNPCPDQKMNKKCEVCECRGVNHKDDDHKVAHHTDCSARCCCESNKSIKSTKSRDSCKRVDTFPFLSFFSQICRLKPRKLEIGELHKNKKQITSCECKEKLDRLETRMANIERGLMCHFHDGISISKPNELRATPQPSSQPLLPPPQPTPPPPIRPNAGIERPDVGTQRPNTGIEEHDIGMQRANPDADRHDMGMQRSNSGVEGHDMGMQRPNPGTERYDTRTQRPNPGMEGPDMRTQRSNLGIEGVDIIKSQRSKPGMDEYSIEIPKSTSRKNAFNPPPTRGSGKRKRRSKLDREEKKIKKKLMGTAWAYKKWDELERRQKLRDLEKLKKLKVSDFKRIRDREAAAFYYTVNTPSLAPSVLHFKEEDKRSCHSKSSYQFQKRINDGLSSLHSIWENLRNRKFGYGMGNFVNKMRRPPSMESDVLIDDSSRSSQMPRTREVFEMKEEPTSFVTKHVKPKKSDKHVKKEKASPKSKSGRARHR